MLKLHKKPVFTRTVYIEQPSPEKIDKVDRDEIKVTFRILDAEQLTELAAKQKELAASTEGQGNMSILAEAIDACVESIEGFGDEDGQPITGAEAKAEAKSRWGIGRQIIDHYWTALRDPRARGKN